MKSGNAGTGWSQFVMLVSGGCCNLLGLVVLFGWYSDREVFTPITASLAPMQPNTALSFWPCPVREAWDFEAYLHLQDFRGYQAIGWVDPTFHVRWLVPVEGNEDLQDRPLPPRERQRIELATMWDQRLVLVSHAIDLP